MKSIFKYLGINVKNRFLIPIIVFPLTATMYACEEFIEVDPPRTEVVSETVYASDGTAVDAIRGIYIEMVQGTFASGRLFSVTNIAGLSSDETIDFAQLPERIALNTNSLTANSGTMISLWNEAYTLIYYANSVLEGLENSDGVTQAVKNQLEGEAKFVRAFFHFYLVNLFGDIPVISSTDFEVNNAVSRDQTAEVFQQIITDLLDAQALLAEDYSFSAGERIQPNQSAATSLLARAYLYTRDWENAEIEASKVINNTSLYSLVSDLNDVFLANSTEAIWQLKPVFSGINTHEARAFINESSPNNQVLTDELVGAFEPEDDRRTSWVDSIIFDDITYYHPFKYKVYKINDPLTEYSMVLRLAEQYLIRAEARAHQGNVTGAQSDLNTIRTRASLENTSANDMTSMLFAIEQERKVELFTEWGHRWFDLKRNGRTEAVLSPIQLKNWQSTDVLYPIPQNEIQVNPKLTQNEGY